MDESTQAAPPPLPKHPPLAPKDHAEAIAINGRLLSQGSLPPQLVDHVSKNRQFSVDIVG